MMEHLNIQSMDKVAANVAKIRELFPNCVTERINNEGKLEHAIDFDMLRQELSDHVVDGLQERYQFTWPEKSNAILAANASINNTLRPYREESVDFDNTENLYIEGDNLEVLKLLQETYLGKVKMIYIDPPYNTGNDFVYRDEFKQNADEYIGNSGQVDEEGNRLVTNTESNGRFHTNWLNMIYPRLKLAKDLLSEDGVIFISIGEEEISSLKSICDEIFGNNNYISNISRIAKTASNMGNFFAASIDYILCYARDINKTNKFKGDVDATLYRKVEAVGIRKGEKYRDDIAFFQSGLKHGGSRYPVLCPDGQYVNTPNNKPWRANEETFNKWNDEGLIVFKQTNTSPLIDDVTGEQAHWNLYTKSYLKDREKIGTQPRNILTDFINRKGADLIKKFGIPFDFAKPIELLVFLIKIVNDENSLILDFFSGSATTAHAVMQLNAEDGGKRKFIMVQLPEVCAENSEAYKAGYKNICEIGKERIRRAGQKIKEENPLTTQDLDIGFRVLKCDSSNMEDVYYTPREHMDKQQSLFVDNIKEGRDDEDLLFQVMLELDTPLSSKIIKTEIAGKVVYNVAQGHLMACFDRDVTDEVITAIAKEMPSYFVMRDSSLANDSVAINFEQIFNTYSPQTVRRVL